MRQKRRSTRVTIVSILMGMLMSLGLVAVSSGTANADTTPALGFTPPPNISNHYPSIVTDPTGNVTVGCNDSDQDLTTFSPTGAIVRQIPRTPQIDGFDNCIMWPAIDKNGVLYGEPVSGPNLLAYDGNTLKWKFPASCDTLGPTTVGANGNIYTLTHVNNVYHLIGIAPNLATGQTTPTKVLDVTLPSGNCGSNTLTAYKDGIVIGGNVSTTYYYSYAGKLLGQLAGSAYYDRLNADGKTFRPVRVSGTTTSASVSEYDPGTGVATWTTSVSTPGANVQNIDLYPLSGGGVTAVIKEHMVTGGIPTPDNVYVNTLVTLNAAGQKVWSTTLANTGSLGDWGRLYVNADGANRIVLRREFSHYGGTPYTRSEPEVVISVLDANTGNEMYNGMISGPMDTTNNYGFQMMDPVDTNQHPLGAGTVFMGVQCSGSCTDTHTKLYAIKVTGLGVDYPQGVVLTANTGAQPAPRSYMALGDSFSSGEGNPPFVDTTACDRSTVAYSRVNGLNPYTTLQLDQFVACSGAQTTNVLNGWYDSTHSEPSQVSVLSAGSPKVVTITIGGNDIGFSNLGKACVTDTCNFSSATYNASLNAINNTLGASLTTTYKKLLEVTKTAGTKVYVLGYPQVIANKAITDPGDARCPYMYESVPVASGRYWEDARAARDIVTRLDTKISDTVNAVRALSTDNQRLIFVTATGANSPFIGHEVCGTSDSYFNNVDQALNGLAYVFHPNAKGQAAYAQLVRQAIGE